jgi:hypothetical protein
VQDSIVVAGPQVLVAHDRGKALEVMWGKSGSRYAHLVKGGCRHLGTGQAEGLLKQTANA